MNVCPEFFFCLFILFHSDSVLFACLFSDEREKEVMELDGWGGVKYLEGVGRRENVEHNKL